MPVDGVRSRRSQRQICAGVCRPERPPRRVSSTRRHDTKMIKQTRVSVEPAPATGAAGATHGLMRLAGVRVCVCLLRCAQPYRQAAGPASPAGQRWSGAPKEQMKLRGRQVAPSTRERKDNKVVAGNLVHTSGQTGQTQAPTGAARA